ncbi:hypothetical protein D0T84_12250 [Dysgonomonas sp. 521]|uniref:radical SAM-associated putative lipoprotein n=1 Tax=Dysgonomonas sp. 521 TaxID=2302932 RepID=UPI0013D1C032|nr:radical SAM-associated putative lipoprotein [Dysgonomonas sp. 521]NDV95679.1 hypothetical protein [Dysgonomonas sp. 521]
MKIKCISVYSRILSFLLVLLGFSSCSSEGGNDCGGRFVAMYGTPSAKFVIDGKVVNKNNKPVSGLKVAVGHVYLSGDGSNMTHYADSINTSTDGAFRVAIYDFPADQKFVIRYEGTESPESSFYGVTTDTVRFENPTFSGDNNCWYEGEITKNLGTVVFDPKKSAE